MNGPKDLFRPAVLRKGESDLVYKQYDEICRLRAELEQYKPKPVIQAFVHSFLGPHVSSSKHMIRGLIKLYYDDSTGIIVSAEVLSDK